MPRGDTRHTMSQSPYHLGFTTLNTEVASTNLPIHGTLPPWLQGSLLRTGPARFEVGDTPYNHWFDGLAMLHRFEFAAGQVRYANRYLQSQAYREAMAKGTISRSEFATDPCRTLFQRVASWFFPVLTDNGCVNVSRQDQEMVALTETRLPVQFDPATLETLGVREYAPHIKGPVATAHPHYDRARRCGYAYSLEFGWRSQYHLFSIDESGRQTVIASLPTDRPAYMHSFGMTERYLILAESPFLVNPFRLLFRGQPFIRNYRWRPDRGVRFHVVEKETGRVVRTAETPSFFAFHHANAFEEGDDVLVDIIVHPDATVNDQLYLDRLRSTTPVTASGRLTRFRIDPTGKATSETLSPVSIELPRFDYARRAGQRYRYVYGAAQEPSGDFLDSLVKLDLDQNEFTTWHEEGHYPGEPVFVAAPHGSGEDEGVILSVVLDTKNETSFLLVLDAATFTELARAEAPHAIPFGFHGNYYG